MPHWTGLFCVDELARHEGEVGDVVLFVSFVDGGVGKGEYAVEVGEPGFAPEGGRIGWGGKGEI